MSIRNIVQIICDQCGKTDDTPKGDGLVTNSWLEVKRVYDSKHYCCILCLRSAYHDPACANVVKAAREYARVRTISGIQSSVNEMIDAESALLKAVRVL